MDAFDELVEGVVVDAHALEGGQGGHGHGADDGHELGVAGRVGLACGDGLADQRETGGVGHPLVQGRVRGERRRDRVVLSTATVLVSGRSREWRLTSTANSPASTTQVPSSSDQNEKARWSSVTVICRDSRLQVYLDEPLQLAHGPGDRGLDVADIDLDDSAPATGPVLATVTVTSAARLPSATDPEVATVRSDSARNVV